jgi:pyruvate/2-oxoglutarate dehydrogenase complex dihydrolipoamide dehydrogenase (E3) component
VLHEAHVAAEVIAGELLECNKELAEKLRSWAFNARVIPSVAYTDPEVAWVGLTEDAGLVPKASRAKKAYSPGRHQAAQLPTAATKA